MELLSDLAPDMWLHSSVGRTSHWYFTEVMGSNPVEALIFSGFFFPIAQIGKLTAMIILHFHLQPQFKYELFHIFLTLLATRFLTERCREHSERLWLTFEDYSDIDENYIDVSRFLYSGGWQVCSGINSNTLLQIP